VRTEVIIIEQQRPLWQIIVASAIFTTTIAIFCCFLLRFFLNIEIINSLANYFGLNFYPIPKVPGFVLNNAFIWT